MGTKWRSFALATLPSPLVASLIPVPFPTKMVIASALAAAQTATYLASAEHTLSLATDAVALKARASAVADTYANQGARSGAILPFTSALGGLCAAAAAAVVEVLPALGGGGVVAPIVIGTFPFLSSLFAAAAAVSKARCEVDALAASEAASEIAVEYGDAGEVLRPFRGVGELIRLTAGALRRKWRRDKEMKKI